MIIIKIYDSEKHFLGVVDKYEFVCMLMLH
jgi:hypothetical protein